MQDMKEHSQNTFSQTKSCLTDKNRASVNAIESLPEIPLPHNKSSVKGKKAANDVFEQRCNTLNLLINEISQESQKLTDLFEKIQFILKKDLKHYS